MPDEAVKVFEPLPKPKQQQRLFGAARRNSIIPWKHPRAPAATPPTRQQSLTQMIPGLTPARYEVVDSEPDEEIGEPPLPKKQRGSNSTSTRSDRTSSALSTNSTHKQKTQRKKRPQVKSQDEFVPGGSKAKKDQGKRKKVEADSKKTESEVKKPKNTLTQAYNFHRSDPSSFCSDEDEPEACTKRKRRKVSANKDGTGPNESEEILTNNCHHLEVPNSSSQARAGCDPYRPYGGPVGESQHEQQSLTTPQKLNARYSSVEELPNSQPTPTLTPRGNGNRPPLQPKSLNVRFASPAAAKFHRDHASPEDVENTPRPMRKSASPAKQGPIPRLQSQSKHLMGVADDSTEDEDDHCGLLDLGGNDVYNTLSDSQWQHAVEVSEVHDADEEQDSADVTLSLTQLIELASGSDSQFLHMQHLKKVKQKRALRDGSTATPPVPETDLRNVEMIKDSEDDQLDSDADEVYESAVEEGQIDDDEVQVDDRDEEYDMGPRTFNPVDDALDRDASRFLMTRIQPSSQPLPEDDSREIAEDDGGHVLQPQQDWQGDTVTQIKEEVADRIPSTQEEHEPANVDTPSQVVLKVRSNRDGDSLEDQDNAVIFSTAAEANEIVIPSSQEDARAASVQEELLLEGQNMDDERVEQEVAHANVSLQELVRSTPSATARLRPSQISTILPTQASQARLLDELAESEGENEGEDGLMAGIPSSERSSSPELADQPPDPSPRLHRHDSAPTSPPSHTYETQHIELSKVMDWMPPPERDDEDANDEQAALPTVPLEEAPSQQQKSLSTNQSSPLIGPPGYNSNDWTRRTDWSQTQMTNVIDYSLPPPPPLSSARGSSDS